MKNNWNNAKATSLHQQYLPARPKAETSLATPLPKTAFVSHHHMLPKNNTTSSKTSFTPTLSPQQCYIPILKQPFSLHLLHPRHHSHPPVTSWPNSKDQGEMVVCLASELDLDYNNNNMEALERLSQWTYDISRSRGENVCEAGCSDWSGREGEEVLRQSDYGWYMADFLGKQGLGEIAREIFGGDAKSVHTCFGRNVREKIVLQSLPAFWLGLWLSGHPPWAPSQLSVSRIVWPCPPL